MKTIANETTKFYKSLCDLIASSLFYSLEEKYVAFNKKHHVDFVEFPGENTNFVLKTRKSTNST